MECSCCKFIYFSFLFLLLIIDFTNCSFGSFSSGNSLSKETAAAIQNAIDYYNKTMNLAERVEIVEKYYELERDEGVFFTARIRQAPAEMIKISEDLEEIEFEVKDKHHSADKVIEKLKIVEKELVYNFGARDKNFRVRSDDPMGVNLKAVQRMNKHWGGVMEQFNDYTDTQLKLFHTYSLIKDETGIQLWPDNGHSNLFLIQNEENANKILKEFTKTEDFFEGHFDDEEMRNKLKDRMKLNNRVPKQTSQEIQALINTLSGEEIEPSSKEMLKGFFPELNKKAMFIITKLRILEERVKVIDEESQNYAMYIMDKREELYDQLLELKKRFHFILSESEHDEL